jgi:hypothetical protein
MHQFGTFQLQIPSDDTQSSNLLYRTNVGIPNWRGAYGTGDGIPYMDTLNSSNPKLRLLTVDYATSITNPAIVPSSISDQLDLSPFFYDKTVVYEWGDFYVLECKSQKNGVSVTANDTMWLYNKKTGYYDRLDYRMSCPATYYGALLAGDSISGNIFVLFSGFDDDGFNINNYWKSAPTRLGRAGMKRFNRLVVKGLIQPTQNLDIYLAYDGGNFVKIDTIAGNGPYVNLGTPVEVGGPTIGSNIVGGGGTVNAFSFEKEIQIGSDIFDRVAVMFAANSVGFLQIDSYTYKDIRYKSERILSNLSQ